MFVNKNSDLFFTHFLNEIVNLSHFESHFWVPARSLCFCSAIHLLIHLKRYNKISMLDYIPLQMMDLELRLKT